MIPSIKPVVPVQSYTVQFRIAKALCNDKITRTLPSQVDKNLALSILSSKK